MLFMITQVHTPQTCPKEAGGARILYDAEAEGVTLKAMYGAFPQHTIWYVVEADSVEAVQRFLDPGFLRCTATITPVATVPIKR